MVRELGWPPLVDRRREHRLTMLYKIQRGLVDINTGPILRTNDRRTRGGNRIYQPAAPQPVYKYSFYPRTIQEWNRLPATTTDYPTLEEFRKQPPFMFLTVHRGLLMLLTLSGRGRLSHPPNRSTIQSKKTPDLYTEEEEEEEDQKYSWWFKFDLFQQHIWWHFQCCQRVNEKLTSSKRHWRITWL